ncbi:unnamed protein product [Rangifer tarandus platyrhynchus]|uniref:Uncharacterized protein n=1 Tax=Rangifer tarandus platyrhynchus TaxID=3082113 RepID=A0ABN8XJ81_RANTA|nr:unnamed protein product [Rangifer tarandus platyrhynchus]
MRHEGTGTQRTYAYGMKRSAVLQPFTASRVEDTGTLIRCEHMHLSTYTSKRKFKHASRRPFRDAALHVRIQTRFRRIRIRGVYQLKALRQRADDARRESTSEREVAPARICGCRRPSSYAPQLETVLLSNGEAEPLLASTRGSDSFMQTRVNVLRRVDAARGNLPTVRSTAILYYAVYTDDFSYHWCAGTSFVTDAGLFEGGLTSAAESRLAARRLRTSECVRR